jgi:aminotransferase
VRRTLPALIDLIGRAVQQRAASGGRLFPLAQAVPNFDPPPHVLAALRASLNQPATHRYTVDPGLPELRAAVAEVLGARRGVRWDPESQILITAGANLAFAELAPALFDPGEEVLLLSPFYINHGMAVELAGGKVVEVPLAADRGFGLDLEALERAVSPASRALVVVQPSNPIGSVLGRAELEALLRLAARRNLWVVSDETYEDFVYEPPPDGWRSAASFPEFQDRVVVIGSFSKSCGLSGWRVGWLALPAPLTSEVLKCHDTMVICAPVAGQKGALAALRGDWNWLEEHRAELARRRRAVLDFLAASSVLETAAGASRGAMFVLVRPAGVSRIDSTAAALDIIARTGVALVPGAAFGAAGEGWLRLSFAGAAVPELIEALELLERYFKSWKGNAP